MPIYQEQEELARWACDEVVKAGATEARVSVSRTRYVSIEYRDRRVESLEESVEKGMDLTIYSNGRYSAHRTSDLRRDALKKFFGETVSMTGYLAEDAARRLPEPKYYEGRPNVDLGLLDDRYSAVVPDERHRLAKTIEAAALEAGGDRIISVSASYYDSISEGSVVSSNGFSGTTRRTDFWCGASATAKDEGDKRPMDWCWEGGCNRDLYGPPERIGATAAARALARIGQDKLPTEKLPLIVENRTAGRLLQFMGQGLYGRNLQQRSSYLEGKQGQQIASELLTIVDDPLIARGLGSRLYDNEGMTARSMPILEKGVLKNYFIDTYYGRKLGMEPTTASPSNTVLTLGDKDQAAWMREVGRGILITGFLGGNSNSSTGDFSTGIQGFLFENGEIVRPVNEMNLAGNHLEFWHHLVGLGNDPYPFSAARVPCLVFDALTVAGA